MIAKLGYELAKAQQWERAERLANAIEYEAVRIMVLQTLARALESARKHEQMLHLVQYNWQRATTRNYLIALLPLASGLILHMPRIGIAFYEAFTWVDTFLKG